MSIFFKLTAYLAIIMLIMITLRSKCSAPCQDLLPLKLTLFYTDPNLLYTHPKSSESQYYIYMIIGSNDMTQEAEYTMEA